MESRFQIQTEPSATAGKAGYRAAEIQGVHFRERMLLARTQHARGRIGIGELGLLQDSEEQHGLLG